MNRAIAIALTKISFHQNFYTIQILMANVLGLDTCKHYKERQTSLQSKVKMLLDDKFHCLLNDIFHVQVTRLIRLLQKNELWAEHSSSCPV